MSTLKNRNNKVRGKKINCEKQKVGLGTRNYWVKIIIIRK